MALKISKVDVWAAEIQDRSGGLAEALEQLADAGANLDSVIARRQPDKPGTGIVFVANLKGKKIQGAARSAGFSPAGDVAGFRVEGPDKAGLGHRMARAIADAGINMRGLSAMKLGNKFVAYFGFDNPQDADRAAKAVKNVDAGAGRAKAARRKR